MLYFASHLHELDSLVALSQIPIPSSWCIQITEVPIRMFRMFPFSWSNETSPTFDWDTECYPSLALMVHSVFWLVWSHSDMESSSTHSVYSFESVETTVIVISCRRASSGLELISALDKALPMFDLRDTESPLHCSCIRVARPRNDRAE